MSDEEPQEKITQIQEILSEIIVLHSWSNQYSEKVEDKINSILKN